MSCVVTTAVWPVLVASRRPAQSWILSVYGRATVTMVFAGLSCWLLIAARDGGGDLGLVERLTSAAQGLYPLVVALALRQTGRDEATGDNARLTTPGAKCRVARCHLGCHAKVIPDPALPGLQSAGLADGRDCDIAFPRLEIYLVRVAERPAARKAI